MTNGMTWTDPQWAAIEDRGRDLVVSASAGSGKTAVLTERVLRLVSEPAAPGGEPAARIEELLIITFTEKAARQMRERIERRLREALADSPDSPTLRSAYDGLSAAWIMTIDAFCRRLVIENFQEAGVPPTPRIPDAAELAELEREALREELEAWAGDPARRGAVAELIQSCGGGAEGLAEDVRRLIAFLQSLDRPGEWLTRVRAEFEAAAAGAERLADLPEMRAAQAQFRAATAELAAALRELAALAAGRGGEEEKIAGWLELAGQLEGIAAEGTAFRPDELREWLETDVDKVLAKLMNKGVCGPVLYQDDVFKKNFLERFAKHYDRWRKRWFTADEAGLLRGARLAAAQGRTMLDLAEAAAARAARVQARRGLLTFNDFQRLALKILSAPSLGDSPRASLGTVPEDAPSEIAHRLRRQFEYVLVDEYQDTSPLQDAIVRRVARSDDPGVPGNLFLVGDVKQSIYRFRHAEPALFLAKIRAAEDSGGRLGRVSLRENFRSRPGILAFVNACCERIMDQAVGELDYEGEEQLKPGRAEPPGADPVCVEAQWLPRNAEDSATPDDVESGNEGDVEDPNDALAPRPSPLVPELLEGLEAQAHWVARRIRALTDPERGLLIPDEAAGGPATRRAAAGDCAILLRGVRGELEVWTQALEREGLKVRAPGVNPLFSASEMIDLLSALQVADCPFQDVALATLMRSPLGGFGDGELLAIRAAHRHGPFHEAVFAGSADAPVRSGEEIADCGLRNVDSNNLAESLHHKLEEFIKRVEGWRRVAREGAAHEVLEAILRQTGYEAYLMGLLDGLTRIEHLDFLRGLLLRLGRSAEGSNPLAAFLELLERAKAEQGEVGELPETVAGHADAVNLLTIHRAKGLEFPIVFLPRLERPFRAREAAETLLDRELGLARAGVDTALRRRYPTLARRAAAQRLERRDRSEEIRLLYVAMTRARERLVLVAQPGRLEQLPLRWGTVQALGGRGAGALDRLHARCPADLLGPVVQWLAGEGQAPWLSVTIGAEACAALPANAWTRARGLIADCGLRSADYENTGMDDIQSAIRNPQSAMHFLPPFDPGAVLTRIAAKTSVTRLKQERETGGREEWAREEGRFLEEELARAPLGRQGRLGERRPEWPGEGSAAGAGLTAERRGTLTHALAAHVDLGGALDAAGLRAQAGRLIEAGLVGGAFEDREAICGAIDFEALAWFFTTPPGRLMAAQPGRVTRELAFTRRKALVDFDPEAARLFPAEEILLQGVIDVVIDEGQAATVLDYKTDRVRGREHLNERVEKYRFQVVQYAWALQAIWQLKEVRAGLVFMDGREVAWVETD